MAEITLENELTILRETLDVSTLGLSVVFSTAPGQEVFIRELWLRAPRDQPLISSAGFRVEFTVAGDTGLQTYGADGTGDAFTPELDVNLAASWAPYRVPMIDADRCPTALYATAAHPGLLRANVLRVYPSAGKHVVVEALAWRI